MTREEALEAIHNPNGPPTDPVKRSAFESWLDRDAELRRLHGEQAALFATLDEWATPEPSAAFDAQMEAVAEAERERPHQWRRFFETLFAPQWAAAGAIAAIVAVAALVSQGPTVSVQEDHVPKTAVVVPPADADYLDEWDRALEDLEMLTEFEALTPSASEGKS